MAKKKELYSMDVHPNAGKMVSIFLMHTGTGTEVKKTGLWNGTHWSLVNRRTGVSSSFPLGFDILGWHE